MDVMCAAMSTRRWRGSQLTFHPFVHVLLIHLLDTDLFITSRCKDAEFSIKCAIKEQAPEMQVLI